VTEIRAFVGHSFSKDDSEVVRKFLDYFVRISSIVPEFGWVHAEVAEPKQLADKVMRLIADCNVFIGICTRKEYAVDPRVLRTKYFGYGLGVQKDALVWKTSDWIIQEIGLAIGKGLNLILLIEDGVRDPGGLQGNIEYVPFERSALEEAFGKLLEMICRGQQSRPQALRKRAQSAHLNSPS
jgi:hypothetical protein